MNWLTACGAGALAVGLINLHSYTPGRRFEADNAWGATADATENLLFLAPFMTMAVVGAVLLGAGLIVAAVDRARAAIPQPPPPPPSNPPAEDKPRITVVPREG